MTKVDQMNYNFHKTKSLSGFPLQTVMVEESVFMVFTEIRRAVREAAGDL